jgi:hypothetical protein
MQCLVQSSYRETKFPTTASAPRQSRVRRSQNKGSIMVWGASSALRSPFPLAGRSCSTGHAAGIHEKFLLWYVPQHDGCKLAVIAIAARQYTTIC